jgi:hypothetical protein
MAIRTSFMPRNAVSRPAIAPGRMYINCFCQLLAHVPPFRSSEIPAMIRNKACARADVRALSCAASRTLHTMLRAIARGDARISDASGKRM